MNTETVERENQIRVFFTGKPQKKHPYTIPIGRLRDKVFLTGQELSYKKMIGETELTEDEKKKYPVVIDPTEHYKVTHMQPLSRDKEYDRAIIKLLLLSGRVAESKDVFDETPVEYLGYLKDSLAEANSYNKIEDERFEAEAAVRDSTIDDYAKIALIVNYRLGKNIDVKTMPDGYIKAELIKAAKENPKAVKKCFPKWNAAVAEDIYILQLLRHDILSKKPGGDIYDNGVFIGNGIDAVYTYMRKESHKDEVSKWKVQLDAKLGLVSKQIADEVTDKFNHTDRSDKYTKTLDKLKAAILDENLQGAEFHYNILADSFKDMFDMGTETNLQNKMNDLRLKIMAEKKLSEKKKLKSDLEKLDLEEIQKKISHPKTPYKKDVCKDYWEDQDQLIEYMLKVKFSD